jgi:hypothetical protein
MRTTLRKKHEGKRPLGRPRSKWEDSIKINLGKTGCRYKCGLDSSGSG